MVFGLILVALSESAQEFLVGSYLPNKNTTYESQALKQGIYIESTVYNRNNTDITALSTYGDFPLLTMFLDYLPYMVFTNMFAIFYLETICMTKTTAQKQKDDKWMGHLINIMITAFFVILFALLIIFPTAGLYNDQWDDGKTAPGIGFVDIPNYGPTYV
jgi:preprotein translocase subunit SecY